MKVIDDYVEALLYEDSCSVIAETLLDVRGEAQQHERERCVAAIEAHRVAFGDNISTGEEAGLGWAIQVIKEMEGK